MNLNKYLSKEHLAIGLTLTDDEHFIYLKQNGAIKAVWSSLSGVLALTDIIHEADQILNWSLSGISVGKMC